MDQRLLNAAKMGDVVELQNILKDDPLVLEEVSVTPFPQTPLHVAALAGKDDFVKEIIKLMPSFAKEINEKGLSPMHIACAKGYSQIVSELLKLKLYINLCLVKDKFGRTPLHYAIIKGKIDVIEMLIAAYSESLKEVTAKGETVLHLAVKGNQFEALKILIERLKELDSFDMFCAKDKEGNTVLELAEARSQLEVLNLLKEKGITSAAGNAKLSEIIEKKGDGKETENELVSPNKVEDKTAYMNMMSESSAFGNDTKIITIDLEPVESDKSQKTTSKELSIEMKNIILIVATLLATMTYQAGLNPPSTIWKEGTKLDTICLFKKHPHRRFSLNPKFHECPASNFYSFMILNTAGFVCSLGMILYSSPAEYKVRFPLGLISSMLLVNYMSLLFSICPDVLSFAIIWFAGPIIILMICCLAAFALRNALRRAKIKSRSSRSVIESTLSMCFRE